MRNLISKIILVASVVLALLCSTCPIAAEQSPLSVYYCGTDDAVKQALELTQLIHLTTDVPEASAAVINNVRLSDSFLSQIRSNMSRGMGLVLFLGDCIDESTLKALGLDGITLSRVNDPVAIGPTDSKSLLATQVNWRVAPQVRARTVPKGEAITPLVTVHGRENEPVLAETLSGSARVFMVGPALDGPGNRPFREWFYFNYLVYVLATTAAGQHPVAYGDYPGAPVPHRPLQLSMVILLVLMFSSTLIVFAFVRRYSKRHPELIYHAVADSSRFQAREGMSEWEHVGFHRGIAGFMISVLNNVWLWVFVSILVNTVLFGIVLPSSAQLRGAMSLVGTFFTTVWVLMDWGTAVTAQKFLSQHRVKNPSEGLKYVQFFVWWQAITGTIQVGTIALVALFLMPKTALAYLSLYVLLHVMIQFPGFARVFDGVVFPGLQRFDYQHVIGIIFFVLSSALQIPLCMAFIQWGNHRIAYNSIAGGLGIGFGALVVLVIVFLTGFLLYRRLGLSARVIFMAHFDWDTVKTALKFGLPITATGLMFTGAYSIQVLLLSTLVLNYAEVQANFDAALTLGTGAFGAVFAWAPSMMNSYSEAFSQGKLKLSRYYTTMSIKWGESLGLFLTAVLLAVGDRYILGSLGQQYERAAIWIVYIAILWSIAPYIWIGDNLLVGIGKPHLQFIGMTVEQGTRVIIMFLLAARLQEWALITATLVALPLKAVSNTFFMRKHLGRITVNWWQSVFAPLASGVIICCVLRYAGGLPWASDKLRSLVLFIVGLIGALPVHFFLTGLFGGWDDNGLDEFRRAVPMSNIAMPVAWIFLKCTELGASCSPLHNRFPVTTYDEAMVEADEITRAKVRLDQYRTDTV